MRVTTASSAAALRALKIAIQPPTINALARVVAVRIFIIALVPF